MTLPRYAHGRRRESGGPPAGGGDVRLLLFGL